MLKIAFSLYVLSPLGELTTFVEMKSKQIIVKTIKKSEIKNTNKCRLWFRSVNRHKPGVQMKFVIQNGADNNLFILITICQVLAENNQWQSFKKTKCLKVFRNKFY